MAASTTNEFPDDPVFISLLAAITRYPRSEAIVYEKDGLEKTYPELLSDIIHTRDLLREQLPGVNQQGLLQDHHVYIAVLSRGVYEFIVAFLAVRAIGGVSVILRECATQSIQGLGLRSLSIRHPSR